MNENGHHSLSKIILLPLSKSFFSVWRTQIGLKEGVWGHKELTSFLTCWTPFASCV